MDFDKLGVPTVALTIVVLIVVFVALGYLYVVLIKNLARRSRRLRTNPSRLSAGMVVRLNTRLIAEHLTFVNCLPFLGHEK